jgi:plastocyanin
MSVVGRSALAPAALGIALAATASCFAGSLRVAVADSSGKPVARVAVYAVPSHPAAAPPRSPAVMDQAHNSFVPHVLIVQTGTAVDFPNNDTVSHHVYSFSETKPFELALYKGNPHPPLTFDKPGVVVLGCNIHDGMLGYILVVDTPFFGSTGADGSVALPNLPAGDYTLQIWTPRAKPKDLPAAAAVSLAGGEDRALTVRFTAKLAPDHDGGDSSLTWDRY